MKYHKILGPPAQVFFACLLVFCVIQSKGQTISPYLYGQNAWMPSFIYNGHFERVIDNLRNAGNRPFKIIRIGGTTFDDNPPTWAQYENLIHKIRSIGAEPLVQVSIASNSTYAANFVHWLNNTRRLNVKYFSIGNEPDLGWVNERVDGNTITWGNDIAGYFKSRASAMKAMDPTIKIFGPDFSFFVDNVDNPNWDPMARWQYPLLNNNDHGLWGQDANGNYYIDYYAFHVYQYVTPSNVERKLDTVLGKISAINSNYRDAANPLGWAITETNITTNNDNVGTHDKTWSFYTGQHIAQLLGLGMKYKAFTVAPWSIHESNGARTALDLGFFDSSPSYSPRSAYYHLQMLSAKAKKNYAWGYTNNAKVKQVATWDETGYAVMVMNDNTTGGNYTLRLNYDTQFNTYLVYIDVGLAKQYQSYLGPNETQMVFFDTHGNYVGKITYNKTNADNRQPPSYTGSTPDRTNSRVANGAKTLVSTTGPGLEVRYSTTGLNIINKAVKTGLEVRIMDLSGRLLYNTSVDSPRGTTTIPYSFERHKIYLCKTIFKDHVVQDKLVFE